MSHHRQWKPQRWLSQPIAGTKLIRVQGGVDVEAIPLEVRPASLRPAGSPGAQRCQLARSRCSRAWAARPCPGLVSERSLVSFAGSLSPQKPATIVGRVAELCDVITDDKTVSKEHAAVAFHENGRLYVVDLKSTHGTTINGAPVPANKPKELANGALLRFGKWPDAFRCARAFPGPNCVSRNESQAHQCTRGSSFRAAGSRSPVRGLRSHQARRPSRPQRRPTPRTSPLPSDRRWPARNPRRGGAPI